jgi:hypothetical protein
MRKISLFLLGVLISVALAPVAFGSTTAPLYIKKAEVYTRTVGQGIAGEATICSSYHGQVKFEVWVKNTTVTAQYKRKLVMNASGCETFKLNFTPAFSNVSKQGDKIVVDLRKLETEESEIPTKVDSYVTSIKTVDDDALPCGDKIGSDEDYKACIGDFITHRYTNVRVKVAGFDNEKIKLVVTGIQWGGSIDLTIYKDKFKKVIAGNDVHTRVLLTYKGKDEKGNAVLAVDAL